MAYTQKEGYKFEKVETIKSNSIIFYYLDKNKRKDPSQVLTDLIEDLNDYFNKGTQVHDKGE